jgi:hypothetical protein
LIDLNDIATVNQVYLDFAAIYNKLTKDFSNIINEIENIISSSLIGDSESKKILIYFKDALRLNMDENEHEKREVRGGLLKDIKLSRNSMLRNLPRHYLSSFFILRHMKMKDTKTKLLYVLNFYRSV